MSRKSPQTQACRLSGVTNPTHRKPIHLPNRNPAVSAKYLRAPLLLLLPLCTVAVSLADTVGQVGSQFQPNQWANSLQRPVLQQSTLWPGAGDNARQTDAAWNLRTSQQQFAPPMQSGQGVNPYIAGFANRGIAPTAIVTVGPVTQVTLPPVNMTPSSMPPTQAVQATEATQPNPTLAQRAAWELQTAARQLNPFTPRESSIPPPTGVLTPPTAIIYQPSELPVAVAGAFPQTPQGPVQHQAPVSAPATMGLPQASLSQSMTVAAAQPDFTGPPVIGTPLRVANNQNANTLPAPNLPTDVPIPPYQESPFDSLPRAPISNAQVPPQVQLPQPQFPQAYVQAEPHPSIIQNGPLQGMDVGNGYQAVPTKIQQFYGDPFTQQISQRDLNAFIANSVNGYCAPCQKPMQKTCGRPGCGDLCGCRSADTSALWTQFETLIYFLDGYDVPPLVTTSPNTTPVPDVGVLGNPATTTLYGDDQIGEDLRTGGRVNLGLWFDDNRRRGIQGEFIYLRNANNDGFHSTFGGNQIIARPFSNTQPGVNAQNAEIVNMGGVANGLFEIDTASHIYSGAATVRWNLMCHGNNPRKPGADTSQTRLDLLAGYRYFHLGETLGLRETNAPDNGLFPAGTSFEYYDEYRTKNDLHAVEFGFNWLRKRNRHYIELLGSVALGQVSRMVDIYGASRAIVPGVSDDEYPGGFYTDPSQQGESIQRDFAVLPQARAKFGYCISPSIRAFIGYDLFYLSSVVRPGSQINQSLNPAELMMDANLPRRLRRNLPDDDVWLQGASFGLQYNY